MRQVGVKELKAKASEILRCVREEQATYIVTVRGEQVAQLMPVEKDGPVGPDAIEAWIQGMDDMAAEIDQLLAKDEDVSAVAMVQDARRDL